jgi:hypothetical protein
MQDINMTDLLKIAVGFDVLTICQLSTVWCSRERLPAAAAQPAKVRQSCSATDSYYLLKIQNLRYYIVKTKKCDEQHSILLHNAKYKHTDQHRNNWKQHVQRMDWSRVPRQMMTYRRKGKISLGRPLKCWGETVTGH